MEFLAKIDLIEVMFQLLTWTVIIYFFHRIYSNQDETKPKIWKAVIVTVFGLFSFSINIVIFHNPVNLAVLPLGVWIMNFIIKGIRWEVYRKYAWLGFIANFLFLFITITSSFVHHLIFPKDDIQTFIMEVKDDVAIIVVHPSATQPKINKETFLINFSSMEDEMMWSDRWYNSTYVERERIERFPFLLTGTTAKMGSGLTPIIFIEADGKGMLISYENEQRYFRSKEPVVQVKEGVSNEK
ncbi:MAG: hypothetical protein LPK00_14540 [Bacillaceae bacterium]|nr:hypothetical protein [Bacillaceae bacterium]